MTPYHLIKYNYPTPLGIVVCELNSDFKEITALEISIHANGSSHIYKTRSYTVEVVKFKRRLPLYNGESVADTQGWIWRITKDKSVPEKIEIKCSLTSYPSDVILGRDCGEHLDAIGVNNNDWILHIGTEDPEIMRSRALIEDWLPSRFADQLDDYSINYDPLTNITENELITKVPDLAEGEKIHYQYLVAYDKYDLHSANTWLAVNEFKRQLENWIGIW